MSFFLGRLARCRTTFGRVQSRLAADSDRCTEQREESYTRKPRRRRRSRRAPNLGASRCGGRPPRTSAGPRTTGAGARRGSRLLGKWRQLLLRLSKRSPHRSTPQSLPISLIRHHDFAHVRGGTLLDSIPFFYFDELSEAINQVLDLLSERHEEFWTFLGGAVDLGYARARTG